MALTQRDLDEIEEVVKTTVKGEIRHLPTKDEFYEKMDEVVGELKAIREDHTVMTGQIADHEERITKIEKKVVLQ